MSNQNRRSVASKLSAVAGRRPRLDRHLPIGSPPPHLIRDRPAAVTDQQLQIRKAPEDVGANQRRDRQAFLGDEVLVVRLTAAALAAVDVCRQVELAQALIQWVPVRIPEWRRRAASLARVWIQQYADEAQLLDAALHLIEHRLDRSPERLRQSGHAAEAPRIQLDRARDQVVVVHGPRHDVVPATRAVQQLKRPRRQQLHVRAYTVHDGDVVGGRLLELRIARSLHDTDRRTARPRR